MKLRKKNSEENPTNYFKKHKQAAWGVMDPQMLDAISKLYRKGMNQRQSKQLGISTNMCRRGMKKRGII